MSTDIKTRRKALGLTRKELAIKAYVDPPSVQLIELGHQVDQKFVNRIDKTLTCLEAGEEVPDWRPEVDKQIENDPDAHKFNQAP